MSDAEFLLTILRAVEASQGAEFCDRCGGSIWPEFELVRCDFCVGKYGAPESDAVRSAYDRNRARIHSFEREERESGWGDDV